MQPKRDPNQSPKKPLAFALATECRIRPAPALLVPAVAVPSGLLGFRGVGEWGGGARW